MYSLLRVGVHRYWDSYVRNIAEVTTEINCDMYVHMNQANVFRPEFYLADPWHALESCMPGVPHFYLWDTPLMPRPTGWAMSSIEED